MDLGKSLALIAAGGGGAAEEEEDDVANRYGVNDTFNGERDLLETSYKEEGMTGDMMRKER